MSENPRDALLLVGNYLARALQIVCALAGGAIFILGPLLLSITQGMIPALSDGSRSDAMTASPISTIAIYVMLVLIFATLFKFFGNLRAIIVSVGDSDPFTPENATRLNAMAWLFLGVKALTLLVAGLRIHLASLIGKGTAGANVLGFGLYDVDAFVIIIVLFVLARVFRYGAAMREDLKGTV